MTVTSDQVAAAKAKGLINVEPLAAACDKYAFPFYLACVILQKETGGRNIFGHDRGGAFSDPTGKNIEVTEERYREFRRQIDAGKTSNGVGPMQLTYKGYFPDAEDKGYRLWFPADNIAYGVGHILKRSLAANLAKGMSLEKAFWASAKSYNGNSSYADDAQARAKAWKAAVGTADMEPTPTPDPGEDMPTAKEIVAELLAPANLEKIAKATAAELLSASNRVALCKAVWQTDNVIPSGSAADSFHKAETFLTRIYTATRKP